VFKQLTERIYVGVFPKGELTTKNFLRLQQKFNELPTGDKIILTVDCQDIAKANGYAELVKDITVNYDTERLVIIEIQ
jgi:hypothetical protein